jgi:hypothetical protein
MLMKVRGDLWWSRRITFELTTYVPATNDKKGKNEWPDSVFIKHEIQFQW